MLDWKDRRSYESVDDYIDRLYSEMERMEDKFTNLIMENSDLRESLKDTKNDYEQLKKDYAKLSANPYSIDALQRECNELRGRNASLENIKERYDSLVEKYSDLESKYNMTLEDYYETNVHPTDYLPPDFDPTLYDQFKDTMIFIRNEGNIIIDLKKVFRVYQSLRKSLKSSEEHSKALQHVINDIDRDSSCCNCMYKNYYESKMRMGISLSDLPPAPYKNSEELLKSAKDKKSSVGYKSYEELHADIDKFLYTEGELKRGKLPTFTDHLITEAVEKYEFLKGLLTLVFLTAPIVLSWNYGVIYLLLFIPLLVVRLLPSEETVEAFLVEYYKRKENEQNE